MPDTFPVLGPAKPRRIWAVKRAADGPSTTGSPSAAGGCTGTGNPAVNGTTVCGHHGGRTASPTQGTIAARRSKRQSGEKALRPKTRFSSGINTATATVMTTRRLSRCRNRHRSVALHHRADGVTSLNDAVAAQGQMRRRRRWCGLSREPCRQRAAVAEGDI